MNLTDIFKKIELAIQPEVVELASAKLADGTMVEAEVLEAGQNIFLIGSEGEKVAVPVGEYPMEDGRILVVTEEGVIAEIKEMVEEEEKQEVTIEVEAAAAEPTLPEVMAMIQSLKDEVEMMKAEMGKKEEMAAQEAEVKEEEVKEVVMAAEKPIVAAPVEVKPELKFQISAKRSATTADRVFNKLFN
jgi:hypothetical protein